MPLRTVFTSLVVAVLAMPVADAGPGPTHMVEGRVMVSRARWSHFRNAIITESVVLTEDGQTLDLWQGGGTAEGIGMVMSHSPLLLQPGDRFTAEVMAPTQNVATPRTKAGRPQPLQIMEIHEHEALDVGSALGSVLSVAFVRTENQTGAALFWKLRDFTIVYDSAGSEQVSGEREFTELDKVYATWQERSLECGIPAAGNEGGEPIELVRFDTTGRESIEVGNDGTNVVKFRDDTWCRPVEMGKEMCYNPSAAGLTTLFFINQESSKENGKIVDGDIEFNGVNFAVWVENDPEAPGCEAELGNTAAHEIGHFLGLDHTCWDGSSPRRTDSDGDLVPHCPPPPLPEVITEATMYNYQDCKETKKKTLEDGEIAFLCVVYTPLVAGPRGGGGCGSAGEPKGGEAATQALVLAGLSLLWAFRRRRAVVAKQRT